MTNSNQLSFEFPPLKTVQTSRKIEVNFSGGEVTSDAGVILLREIDRKLQLTKEFSKHLPDSRDPQFVEHTTLHMLRQRVYGLCLGYEDLNDQRSLRTDTLIQTAVGKDTVLASPSTLCRFENRSDRTSAVAFHKILLEKFVLSFKSPPTELILDFDATDDLVHGNQVGRFFHGYYRNYCFLPLYVFCGDQLLVSYLRPSNIDGAKHAWAISSLLVRRLRKAWPGVKIIFRGDSGFCRHRMLRWFERYGIEYVVGLPSNSRLSELTKVFTLQVEGEFNKTYLKQKRFSEFSYGANTWKAQRRVIVKAEHTDLGANTRYIVTNMTTDPQRLYESVYCGRGNMENRIKEQQLDLFADRTSCHNWWPNQFRLLLSSLAYVLMETLRREGLKQTELSQTQVGTIRLKILKIGAVIIRNTKRIKIFISSHYPYQNLFREVSQSLMSTA